MFKNTITTNRDSIKQRESDRDRRIAKLNLRHKQGLEMHLIMFLLGWALELAESQEQIAYSLP